MLTTKDVCQRLHTSRNMVQWLREEGVLKMAYVGKGYQTTEEELKRVEQWMIGKRITNRGSIQRYMKGR